MVLTERLTLFQGMMQCRYILWCWQYDTAWNLLSTNCSDDDGRLLDVLFRNQSHSALIRETLESGCSALLTGSEANLLWGIVQTEDRYYVMGPVMSAECSMKELAEIFHRADNAMILGGNTRWLTKFRADAMRALKALPVVSPTDFCKDLTMLYYCVTGEIIHHSDVTYQNFQGAAKTVDGIRRDRHRIWEAEQRLLGMVRNGNTDYRSALDNAATVSQGVQAGGAGSLRQAKISGQTFTSLCTRAAIEGGMTPEAAYTLGDSYIQEIERCTSVADIPHLTHEMYEDFIHRVHRQRQLPEVSGNIQSCMDYIENHMAEKLTLSELATIAGYSESYFYHRFKDETGLRVSDFIQAVRVERAKLLLETSGDTVDQIAKAVGLGSRSYMARIFQRFAGMTPLEYREQNKRI